MQDDCSVACLCENKIKVTIKEMYESIDISICYGYLSIAVLDSPGLELYVVSNTSPVVSMVLLIVKSVNLLCQFNIIIAYSINIVGYEIDLKSIINIKPFRMVI